MPMSKRRKRKCLNCKQLFRPDPRNLRHQRYCTGDTSRRASKTASQRRWLNKVENRDYFCGPDQLARVQHWRSQHPGYARRGTRKKNTLQDDSSSQVMSKHLHQITQKYLLTRGNHFDAGVLCHLLGPPTTFVFSYSSLIF